MHGLQLPNRPAQPLPPLASSSSAHSSSSTSPPSASSSSSSFFRPRPPPNFAQQQRTRARLLRGENKSPFVPKKTQQSDGTLRGTPTAAGKERDLSGCSIDQLQDMLDKNKRLLDSPETFVNLPGGDSRLRAQQARIETRLQELIQMNEIRQEFDATHLEKEEDTPGERKLKLEDGEESMYDVVAPSSDLTDEATSPQTKRRIVARLQLSNPHSMSLSESIRLQREAVERDRLASEKKAQRMELDEKRPEKVGNLLRGALGHDSTLGGFMFGGNEDDSDDESLDEQDIQDWLNQGKTGVNGELNDEENEQLNPLKTAYMTGWNRAAAEEGG
ncbi:hypothetical protein JCM16303_004536 [Sporobolomyces ruberrimus]